MTPVSDIVCKVTGCWQVFPQRLYFKAPDKYYYVITKDRFAINLFQALLSALISYKVFNSRHYYN